MRKTTIRQPSIGRRSNRRGNIVSFVAAIIFMIVGLILSSPFVWVIFIKGVTFHHVTLPIFLMLMGLLIGGPMFIFGLISLLLGNRYGGSTSTAELDLGRIRYKVETDGR